MDTGLQRAIDDIVVERQAQPPFDDSRNSPGLWVSYIVNYASRWALPRSFRGSQRNYSFRTCMVIVGALAAAAIEWYDSCVGDTTDDETRAEKVANSVPPISSN